ncbi:MAG: TIGR02444 family protein, partial [Gammaproteobacteria bacterium]|nr:TIGR02444 family protein [Gammaproteobacteria bacterium]
MQSLAPSEFWDFSLEVYERPEVSRVCLELQDSYGADINMLLFACWIGQSGRGEISVSAWRAMNLRLNKWRDKVIKPLRKLRHILKHEQLAPKGMKDQIFQCELEAEHVEQLVLEKEWGSTRRPLVSGSA